VLTAEAQREFWYQPFHRLELAGQLIDGDREAVRAYLAHFWSHWSGPGFELPEADLDRLVEHYAPPGAFTASIAWYRSGAGAVASALAELTSPPPDPIRHPTTVLWPAHDPLFPRAWADRLDTYFSAATVTDLSDAGHFSSLEAPEAWATAILA
jgi:pimeloyl-ACP methyl ester carboxylesterase